MKLGLLAMPLQPFAFLPADLAPGDGKSVQLDANGLEVRRIVSSLDPLFDLTYGRLWDQFGPSGELESKAILSRRLARSPRSSQDPFLMRYDLLLALAAQHFAAARDHTAIADASGVVVHLSHALVDPQWRRTGLAGWLRAFPLQTARGCLLQGGLPAQAPITLVAEMEIPDGQDAAQLTRLKAYERAGYRKIDPAVIHYHQPDFRSPEIIDALGGPVPLPFQLIVRRVGRETESELSGREVRSLVSRLYSMYARDFRHADMALVWRQLESYPGADSRIALLSPTA